MHNLKSVAADELSHLRRVFMRILGAFTLSFVVFFAVPLGGYGLAGFFVPPLPGGTVAAWAIGKMEEHLLPAGAALVALSPLDPFFAQSSVAAALAFLFVLPLIAYEFWAFVSPALHRHERRGLSRFFLFALAMLVLGAVFSYVVLLPLIMRGLYALNPAEVASLYGLRAVVSIVTGVMLATSFLFLLPVAMMLLSRTGLVPAAFWRRYARHALFISMVLSAIITPDGSGISMVILSVPIGILYGLGYVGSLVQSEGESLLTNSI